MGAVRGWMWGRARTPNATSPGVAPKPEHQGWAWMGAVGLPGQVWGKARRLCRGRVAVVLLQQRRCVKCMAVQLFNPKKALLQVPARLGFLKQGWHWNSAPQNPSWPSGSDSFAKGALPLTDTALPWPCLGRGHLPPGQPRHPLPRSPCDWELLGPR